MKELVIISGKGGSGKTSVVVALASLAGRIVLADCDVDAADLHLVTDPRIQRRESFSGGKKARIMPGHCTACGKCEEVCLFDAVFFDGPGNGRYEKTFRVDPVSCEGCGVCAYFCEEKAIEFKDALTGDWFISETRFGPMVHAKLGVAAENSGKLVTLVRREANKIAEERNINLLLIDGSPGIGCPVIASVTGADFALAVTEPTISGMHDFNRVIELTAHFGTPTVLCVNKWDLNPAVASQIEAHAADRGIKTAGRIRYDNSITKAQIEGKSVIEYGASGAADDLRELWSNLSAMGL